MGLPQVVLLLRYPSFLVSTPSLRRPNTKKFETRWLRQCRLHQLPRQCLGRLHPRLLFQFNWSQQKLAHGPLHRLCRWQCQGRLWR